MSVNTSLAGLSTTPANNGPDGSVDPPSTLDDSIRYGLSFIAQLRDATISNLFTAYTSAGTSTAYTITPSPAITAYAANQSFLVTFHVASGASPTLQISGLAAPPNIVRRLQNGAYQNVSSLPASPYRITLVSATQALAESVDPLIVGTVSQAAGVPTGAIIERISNANGEAVRCADGMQLCWGTFPVLALGIGITALTAVTFAAAFVNTAYALSATGTPDTTPDFYGCTYHAPTSVGGCSFSFKNGTSVAQNVANGKYMVLGRWF